MFCIVRLTLQLSRAHRLAYGTYSIVRLPELDSNSFPPIVVSEASVRQYSGGPVQRNVPLRSDGCPLLVEAGCLERLIENVQLGRVPPLPVNTDQGCARCDHC